MRYQEATDSGGATGTAAPAKRRPRSTRSGSGPAHRAEANPQRTPAYPAPTSTGLVIPSLGTVPTVIERDTTLPDTLAGLLELGYLKPDDAHENPVQSGFEAMIAQFPTLNRADEDWGDSLMVTGDLEEIHAVLFNRALTRVIFIKPVIDQLLLLNDPAVLNWLGYRLGRHVGLLDPRCKWLAFVDELQGEEMTDDNGDPLPRADDHKIEAFKQELRSRYPYMLDPTPTDITPEQVRDRVATLNPELADVLYALGQDSSGFGEAYATIGLEPNDLISHGIERFSNYEYSGYSECMEDTFCATADNLTELVALLAEWEALIAPIEKLNHYTCKLTSQQPPTSDSPGPS